MDKWPVARAYCKWMGEMVLWIRLSYTYFTANLNLQYH